MAERGGGGFRYTAFLSYSHRDAAAAERLHRRLETYRLPRRLVGTAGAQGPVPDRLWPIFRDRDELPAATDLTETVREALAQSGALIILCSPHSAASLWVAEEIATFRALYPDRPILAAILEGDPPDCFPPALREFGRDGTWHEPLATDLRPQGDGPHLGLLKLVAGVTGVGLDALVQRDANRRIRRVTAVTVGAVAAMLVMAALTLVALGARADAERQRAEAEGLVEYMLTDLRTRLKGVGRLDVMTAVNQRALAHYGSQQQLGRLSPEELERRARVLHAMGEDDVARGELDAALPAFLEAHRTTAEQLDRSENDPDRIFAHAQSEYWVGRVHELRRNWPVAASQYERYAAGAERLIRIAPDNPDYMMEMGWGALNQGIVALNGGRNGARAQPFFEEAIGWFARATRVRPNDEAALREQANAYAWLADSFYVRELWRESLAAREAEHRIKTQLQRADPLDAARIYDLAIAERSVATVAARAGDRSRAPLLLSAYERARWLTGRDPRNARWLLLKTKIECNLLAQVQPGDREISDAALRSRIRSAGSALSSRGSTAVAEIRLCLRRAGAL